MLVCPVFFTCISYLAFQSLIWCPVNRAICLAIILLFDCVSISTFVSLAIAVTFVMIWGYKKLQHKRAMHSISRYIMQCVCNCDISQRPEFIGIQNLTISWLNTTSLQHMPGELVNF